MDSPELIAVVYEVSGSELTVERRNIDQWAVIHFGFCYSREHGDFEHEPLPSSRTEEFVARTRFSFDEAKQIALRLAPEYPDRRKPR
jgi:hypothetical protein